MLPARRVLLPLVLVLLLSSTIVGQVGAAAPAATGTAAPGSQLGWEMLGGPPGPVSRLAIDPQDRNQVYAVSRDHGLYRSADGGVTWEPATNNLPPGSVSALYADPIDQRLYVALDGSAPATTRGLWASADRGATWEHLPLDPGTATICTIARNAGGHYLMLGMALPRSDAGQGPGPVPSPAPSPAPAGASLYRSADNGSTWEQSAIVNGQDSNDLLADLLPHPSDERRLLAVTAGGRVYGSADGGQSWTPASGLPAAGSSTATPSAASGSSSGWARLARVPDQPDTVYLARQVAASDKPAAPEIARSTDGGATWRAIAQTGLPDSQGTGAFLALPGALLLGMNTGAYYSSDGGGTWRLLEGPLSSGGVNQFAALPGAGARDEVLAATGYGLFASRDGGALWQPLGKGLPANSEIAGLLTNPEQPGRLYALPGASIRAAGSGSAVPPAVLASQDAGRSWQLLWTGLPSQAPSDAAPSGAAPAGASLAGATLPVALVPHAPAGFYAATGNSILHSTDGGVTWVSSPVDIQVKLLAAASSDSGVAYGFGALPGQDQGVIVRTRDGGATWSALAPGGMPDGAPVGLALDPGHPERLWVALAGGAAGGGVFGSTDGGSTWRPAGLSGKEIRWLSFAAGEKGGLYAGVAGDGVYRMSASPATGPGSDKEPEWVPVAQGLPAGSTVLAFLPDPRTPGTHWASRQGGGVYRSTDGGGTWSNVAQGMGDNEVAALAIDYATPGGILAGTRRAGIWSLRPDARSSPAPKAVDARIEIVWPHDNQPVTEAVQANLGLRLFMPNSLVPPPCSWRPNVVVWQAVDTSPAVPLQMARQRTVNGRPAPWWDLNDMDVRIANDPAHKMYYMVQVEGLPTATSVWAHGSDARTFFPQQDVPSGIAAEQLDALDARIEIVWPHDGQGQAVPVTEAPLANVAVALFKHGTRLSVPPTWEPPGLTLYGAWNQEIGRPLSTEATKQVRQSGAVTYPVWEFTNVPVALAANPENKLYLWVKVDGAESFPTLWTHGADARTNFPVADEPVQGCAP